MTLAQFHMSPHLLEKLSEIVEHDEEKLGGKAVFKGTRVPVDTVLDYFTKGWDINDIREAFPSVKNTYISKLFFIFSRQLNATKEKRL